MSATDVSTTPPPAAQTALTRSPVGAAGWVRVVAACAILLGSYGVRVWQQRRIEDQIRASRLRPRIVLSDIPKDLGRWKGSETKLDEQIVRGTGADQIITRRYVNQDTGAAVDMIMLYGPAAEVYLHAPEICYPAAGFSQAGNAEDREVVAGSYRAPFRAIVYTKGEGSQATYQEVYYSWWYSGHWSPNTGSQKHFERIPGMYKLHLARPTTDKEKRDVGNPCESLLKELLPEIEHRMTAAPSTTSSR